MSDLPLKQLDPQVPSNKSPDGTVHVKKRDRFRKFLGIQKSTSKEVKHKPSNQSLDVQPLSEQSTRLPSVTSQVSSYHSGDNQSVFLSTALENKPLPAPPAVDRACMDDIFVDNISKPVIKTVLPRLQERIESTEQLIYCGSLLLQDTLSSPVAVPGEEMTTDTIMVMQKPTLDKAELDWLEEVKRDPMEQDRLHWLVTRMVDEFVANTIKDSTEIAEIVSLTPILQKETYHRLLASLIKDLDAARILNVALLQGLVQLIEGASPGFLEDDDLVRTLAILLRRLQATHKPSSEYVYQMTIAISRLLDIMVNVIVKDVNRTQDYQPLLAALNDLKNTADLKLHFQVHYALQASQYIPDDESTLRTVLRFAGGITIAALGIATLCKLNPANLFSSLNTLQQAAGQSFKVAKSILEGLEASQQGRFRAMQGLLKGIRAGTKYEWYLALLAARSFVREGRLDDFKKTVCEAPCRDEHFFQLGVCQILGEIAVDPLWSPHIRQQAIDFLGALFRNGTGWKQHSDVKQWIDTSLTHLSMLQDPTVSNHARLVLKDLGRDQASITTTSANKSYLLSCRLSLPELSLVLSRVQHIPYVEYELNALKIQRLEEVQQQVYIPPLAKANLQARDDDLFPLMEKVQEFLTSEREVMLILGDSGAGKSTFNRHLEHHLWTNYKKNDPIPLFINLPAIDRPDLDMVIKQLQIHNFTEDQVQGMKQHRQFILICDGYDESQLIANLHRTNRLNQQDQWRAKMVISCRSQFLGPVYLDRFVPHSTDHYKPARLDLFQEVVIAPFSKNQVQDYVARYVPLEPRPWVTEDYMQMLATIPNLMDLVKNPFLLTLALEALPGVTEGQKDLSAITVTRVQLYDHFVDMWLSVNMRRLQDSVLSTQDREMLNSLLEADFISRGVSYSTNLAIAIFEKQDGNPVVRYIHLDDDSTWKAEYFGPQPKARLLRESSPLTRTGNLHRFVHRSMLEYFLSRAVFDPSSFSDTDEYSLQLDGVPAFVQSLDHRTLLFQQDLLTEPSVIGFLCERVKQHPGFEKQLLLIIDKSVTDPTTATAAANAMTILVRAGVQFNGADLRGIRIPKADLSDGQFDSAQLQNADLTSVNFSRSWLRQADLSGAKMNGIRFGELPSLKDKLYAFLSAYSPDGKLLVVGVMNSIVSIYDTATWTRVLRHTFIGVSLLDLAFSPNNQQLVFAVMNNTLRLWDITSRQTVLVLTGHTEWVLSVAFSPCGKRIASGSYDSTIRLWDSATGECLFVLRDHSKGVTSVAYSPDGHRLVSGSDDKTIRMWNLGPEEPSIDWIASDAHHRDLVYSSDGRWLALTFGHEFSMIRLVDAVNGELGPVMDNTSSITSIALSRDGQWIITSSKDLTIRLWSSFAGVVVSLFSGHVDDIQTCAFSPDGLQIASGDIKGNVRLWEVNSGDSALNAQVLARSVRSVAYSPDGRSILSGGDGQGVQQWDSLTGALGALPVERVVDIHCFAFAPSGNPIALGCGDGAIRLWSRSSDVAERTLLGHTNSVAGLTFSPCGRWLVSSSLDRCARLWDLHDLTDPGTPVDRTLGDAVASVAFSPTGHQFAIGTRRRTFCIRLYDPKAKNPCPPLMEIPLTFKLNSLAYSLDGNQLVLGASNPSVYICNLQSDGAIAQLNGHSDKVCSVAYSPCGRWIISGSQDTTVRLWRMRADEADSWPCVAVVRGCSQAITSLAWNPVVPMEFVTGCEDGSIRVWRILSGNNEGEGGVSVQMLWGNNVGRLCAVDLCFKDALGFDPILQRLLVQRGAVNGGSHLNVDENGLSEEGVESSEKIYAPDEEEVGESCDEEIVYDGKGVEVSSAMDLSMKKEN